MHEIASMGQKEKWKMLRIDYSGKWQPSITPNKVGILSL